MIALEIAYRKRIAQKVGKKSKQAGLKVSHSRSKKGLSTKNDGLGHSRTNIIGGDKHNRWGQT